MRSPHVRRPERPAAIDVLPGRVQGRDPGGGGDPDDIDALQLEREVIAMLLDDEQGRLKKARRQLAVLLNMTPEQADGMELFGVLRVPAPPLPPTESLVGHALQCRPDLAAHRLGIGRALADARLARADRIPDPYFLYTPWAYRDNSQMGLESISNWGAGLFVSIPVLNRNQGNIRRSHLNVAQSESELDQLQRRVVDEVRQAMEDYEGARADCDRLDRVLLPAVRRKREKALERFEEGRIDADAYLSAHRDYASLVRYARQTVVRYRRSSLNLNTAVGDRIIP